jgi:hypothetical protein
MHVKYVHCSRKGHNQLVRYIPMPAIQVGMNHLVLISVVTQATSNG